MTATRATFVALVAAQQGVPYVFGGTSLKGTPSPGLDCSGLPYACALALGIDIPRTSEEQFAGLEVVPDADVMQGDLAFYDVPTDTQPQPAHEAMVWVPGVSVIQAPQTGDVVRVAPLHTYPIMGYRRVPFASPAPTPLPPVPVPLEEESMFAYENSAGKTVVVGKNTVSGNLQVVTSDTDTKVTGGWSVADVTDAIEAAYPGQQAVKLD